jgi:cytochrome c peroxidase
MTNNVFYLIFLSIVLVSCEKEDPKTTTPHTLVQPYKFPLFPKGEDKNITEEGIKLGRHLFYEPMLSGDGTMSCATCHIQEDGFSDKRRFSIGIDGSIGERQAMPIINVAWMTKLFWDGSANGVQAQALVPVENPIEMKAHWHIVVEDLKKSDLYIQMFDDAFPGEEITKDLAANAIAQFEKTIISSTSKFDKFLKGQYQLTEKELRGYDLFFSEQADCFHCHSGALITDLEFHNNGLDLVHTDLGLELVTGNPNDRGKFKTPTLRNISYTAPYMHDGRFATLDEVIEFYSSEVKISATIDPLMEFATNGGVQMSEQQKEELKSFLLLFNDEEFLNNPDFKSPF